MFVARPAPAPSVDLRHRPASPARRCIRRAQRYGYVAGRTVTATLADVTKASAVVDAMRSAGATSIAGVQFVLRDRRAAYDEALAAALEDAAAQAQAVASASHMHVAGIQTIRVGENLLGPADAAAHAQSAVLSKRLGAFVCEPPSGAGRGPGDRDGDVRHEAVIGPSPLASDRCRAGRSSPVRNYEI